jgi:BirA family biotin operon repressor/biotin-[acetyl-CoA-carboxylase] ligase
MTGLKITPTRYDKIAPMDESSIQLALSGLPLGPLRYFDRLGSTNDEAARWAAGGAPDLALVVADEQTAGRGRLKRRWHTPPGAALAFSLILRPTQEQPASALDAALSTRLTALGALAVAAALESLYSLPAEIKWPNDVLVDRRKLAGILAEAGWQGDQLQAVILGIGVNVAEYSVPPEAELNFPAASVAGCLAAPGSSAGLAPARVDRLELLRAILEKLLDWRPRIGSMEFLSAWEERLAFRGEWVRIVRTGPMAEPPLPDGEREWEGQVLGLEGDGALRLLDRSGRVQNLQVGEIHLRSAVRR